MSQIMWQNRSKSALSNQDAPSADYFHHLFHVTFEKPANLTAKARALE